MTNKIYITEINNTSIFKNQMLYQNVTVAISAFLVNRPFVFHVFVKELASFNIIRKKQMLVEAAAEHIENE